MNDAVAYSHMFTRVGFTDRMADAVMGHWLLMAYDLSQTDGSDTDLIWSLGEGWTADEVPTMAAFACARHPAASGTSVLRPSPVEVPRTRIG